MTTRPTTTGKAPATGPTVPASPGGSGGAGGEAPGRKPSAEPGPETSNADTSELSPVPAERAGKAPRATVERPPRPAAVAGRAGTASAAAPAPSAPPARATRPVTTSPSPRPPVTARAPQPTTPVAPDRTGSGAAAARPTAVRQGPRRARLLVTRLDPWSVMKTFFMLSVAVAIVLVVATALLWWTLDVTGVFAAVNRTVDDVVGTGSTPFDFMAVAGFERVMGATLVLAAVEIVLVSAMATLFAFLYNLTVGFTRGLEVTLTEDS